MHTNDEQPLSPDLVALGEQLRDEAPRASSLELERIRVRTLSAGRPRPTRSGGFMKTRLAITAMLVSGLIAGGGGAAMAVTGLSGSNDASVAQYGQGVNPAEGGNNPSGSGVAPATGSQGVAAARQGSSGSGLAFTGYLAIPVMLAGIFLLGMGLLMRRRAAADLE
jgi:hypothetical protein